jgi:hypothetical protein
LFGLGFKHVGDVVCSASENVGVRGYAKPGGNAWACCRVAAPSAVEFEIVSTFADGDAILVTTARAGERDEAASNTFRQGLAGAGPKELVAEHQRRLAELAATLGEPRTVVPSSRSLAETLEAVLRK